jgi:hypothetical protein
MLEFWTSVDLNRFKERIQIPLKAVIAIKDGALAQSVRAAES